MKKIVFPAFELSLGGKTIFIAISGVAVLLGFMIFIIFLTFSLGVLVYNTAVLLALLVSVTVFIMFLEYSVFLADIFKYGVNFLTLLLKGFEGWTAQNLKHLTKNLSLSFLSIVDLLIIFTLLASVTTKTILSTGSFYGLNGITVFLLLLAVFSASIIVKVYKDYGSYYSALNHMLKTNENTDITSFLDNFLQELLEHSKKIFITRFLVVIVALELFTWNVLNGYMNSFLPTLELFFSLAITLILYLTFKTTIQVTPSQQPKILTKKVETSKKEELKNKHYEKKEDKTIIPSTLPSKEKKLEENKQPQMLNAQLILPIGKTTAKDKDEEKEFKVEQKKPLVFPAFPTGNIGKNFKNIKVVKVEDIEGRRESEISKLVEEIKDELKKLHEKSRSKQNFTKSPNK
ncbi:hypothetical protein CW703_04810 [Candidatus Bathyarchaeota archaeon]|nr:MAG: hypothetical protein CW703_04810 [Candidatus Bathyarchaeota archaeon]